MKLVLANKQQMVQQQKSLQLIRVNCVASHPENAVQELPQRQLSAERGESEAISNAVKPAKFANALVNGRGGGSGH
ncbi:hypothetical protein X975_03829, partial [Stegodyphus mimosarum]